MKYDDFGEETFQNSNFLYKEIKRSVSKSNLGKLSEVEECILDPSMLPILPDLKHTKLKKIWIPDDFFKIKTKSEMSKLIHPWSKTQFSVQRLFKIFKERKIGKAIVEPIIADDYYWEIFGEVNEPSKSKKRRIIKKIISYAYHSKKIIISKTRKLSREAKKLGLIVLDLSNRMVDGKQRFFDEKTRGIVKRTRGWRYIGGVTLGIVTGFLATPLTGIGVGLTFASVDP